MPTVTLPDEMSDHWNIDAVCRHYGGACKSWAFRAEARGDIPASYKVGGKKFWSRRAILDHDTARARAAEQRSQAGRAA